MTGIDAHFRPEPVQENTRRPYPNAVAGNERPLSRHVDSKGNDAVLAPM